MKKKIAIIISCCLLAILVIGGIVAYTIYDKAGDYVLQKTFDSQVKKDFLDQTGIDLTESGRVLTEEELEVVQALFLGNGGASQEGQSGQEQGIEQGASEEQKVPQSQTESNNQGSETNDKVQGSGSNKPSLDFSKPVTTDDVRVALEERVGHILSVVPTKDKNAMMNLVLGNIPMSDINYLMRLASDGISSGDIKEAKRIAIERFDTEELETAKTYYYKYKHLLY